MHADRTGSGSRVFVGLHGWGGNRRTFRRLYAHMPADAVFYSFDLPGCGACPPPERWTFSAVADAVAQAVAEVPGDRFTLVGNCGGAVYALTTAQRIPDRVERLVLIDPFAYLPAYFRIFTRGELGRRAYWATFANPLGRLITNLGLRGKRAADTDLSRSFRTADPDVALGYLRIWDEVKTFDAFADVRAPIEMIHGERTFQAVRRSVAEWRKVWPEARCTEIAGTGHLPLLEAPEAVAARVFATDAAPVSAERPAP